MTDRIGKPGVYDIGKDQYHADPIETPSLSASIAWELENKSPLHAKTKHPRLNPDFEPEVKDIFDLGSAAHNMVLRQDYWREEIKVVMAKDWRSKEAKAAKADARKHGLYPILFEHYRRLDLMVTALEAHPQASKAFCEGHPERTLVWQDPETGAWLRCRPDWAPYVDTAPKFTWANLWPDYKTTTDARPQVWDRRFLMDHGGLMRAAFYEAGIKAVCGVEKPTLYYVVQEVTPPYAVVCRVVNHESEYMAAARGMFRKAVTTWAQCLEKDEWPSYDPIGEITMNEWAQRDLVNEYGSWAPREKEAMLEELAP